MPTILVVDDTAVERHRTGHLLAKASKLEEFEGSPGLDIIYAANGREALEVMQKSLPDLVVTDLMMPEINGLDLVKKVRATYPSVPVVLITAHGSEEIAGQALIIGAAGYVPKRHLAEHLRDTVENILRLNKAAKEQERILGHMTECQCHFLLHNDLSLIEPLVGFLHNDLKRIGLCYEADEVRITVALREALVNAFTHGNLEIPSTTREQSYQVWYRVLMERSRQPPYRDRRVHVSERGTPAEVTYIIRDEGPGFDYADLPDPTDLSNLEKASGRGLFLIRTFMDEVRFNDRGNEITMIKRRGFEGEIGSAIREVPMALDATG